MTATAEVQGTPLTNPGNTDMRSPDFTGDGKVNYFDTFQYLLYLNPGTGYCGNLNGDPSDDVNFFDTSKYLIHLAEQAECP